MAAQAEAVLSGASQAAEPPADLAQAAAARGETVDLFEYLDSLPEVEDPFPPSEPDPEPAPEPERKPAEMLAEYIRERTKSRSTHPSQGPGPGRTAPGRNAGGAPRSGILQGYLHRQGK